MASDCPLGTTFKAVEVVQIFQMMRHYILWLVAKSIVVICQEKKINSRRHYAIRCYTIQRKDLEKNCDFKKKKNPLGPYATFYLKVMRPCWLKFKRCLYWKGGDEQLKDELTAYNPLVPNGKELQLL